MYTRYRQLPIGPIGGGAGPRTGFRGGQRVRVCERGRKKEIGFQFSNAAQSSARARTYNVLDARFVSSCFSCPSRASPHLSLLLASNGVSWNTLDRVKPGAT